MVKIENSLEARPQSGLQFADVVYEELVEGGETRFLAIFQSTVPGLIGPVRSVRPMDPPLAAPLAGLFAYSGGIPAFITPLRLVAQDLGAGTVGEGAAYVRVSSRAIPHNLYADPLALWAKARRPYDGPPPTLFDHADAVPPAGTKATRLDVRFPGGDAVRWQWQPGRGWWRNESGIPFTQLYRGGARTGTLTTDNVVVQFVGVRPSGYVDTAGSPVPDSQVVGSGQAWLLRDGVWFKGSWSKPRLRAVTRFAGPNGQPLRLRPGRTWVELFPSGGTASVA